MTWEITRNKNGMVIAEHARRSDNHKPASVGERCRLTETRPGFLGVDYMPGRTGVTVPAREDYQELADITQRIVTAGHIEEPFRPVAGEMRYSLFAEDAEDCPKCGEAGVADECPYCREMVINECTIRRNAGVLELERELPNDRMAHLAEFATVEGAATYAVALVVNDEGDVFEPGQWEAVAAAMDDEIREGLHSDMAPCTNQAFFDAYCLRHEAEHGATWELAKSSPQW